jgi:LmbE family N-acetylglucosaminyl deacetylase
MGVMRLMKAMIGSVLLLLISRSLAAQDPQLDRGAVGLALALRRLPVTATLLHTTAHPDDEDNPLLLMMRRGKGIRTGLLTLTRGDGGQNEIGPELFQALGIIRTEELMAVHRYDDVRQFFTRAYEFGYSFSAEETLERWGEEQILADMVRVIRTFRPQVILCLSRDGKGGGQHHQASARLSEKAFHAAADVSRFPEQLEEGLRPWKAKKLYERFRWRGGLSNLESDAAKNILRISTGAYDPVLGKTYAELGLEARSMHKCQGMNQVISVREEHFSLWRRVSPGQEVILEEGDIFDGIETGLMAIRGIAGGQIKRVPFLVGSLKLIQSAIDRAQQAFTMTGPGLTAPFIARGLDLVRSLKGRIVESQLDESAKYEILFLLNHKEQDFVDALNMANQLSLDVLIEDGNITPGQEFNLQVIIANRGPHELVLKEIEFVPSESWGMVPGVGRISPILSSGEVEFYNNSLRAPMDARVSEPYWSGPNGPADRYEIKDNIAVAPWDPAPLSVRLHYRSFGVDSVISSNAEHRYPGSWVGGEQRHDLMIVPDVSVSVNPEVMIFPLKGSASGKEIRVTAANQRKGGLKGDISLQLPEGWRSDPILQEYTFSREGESITKRFILYPDTSIREGAFQVNAVGHFDGKKYQRGYQVIDYDHTRRRHLYHSSSVEIRAVDVTVTPGLRLGYVAGVGDYLPNALQQLGIDFEILEDADLAFSDLSRFDTIITGIRAYLVRDDLRSHNNRLLDWVEAGGTLIVQYNKFEFNGPSLKGGRPSQPSPYTPYPLVVSNGRVTDETAPIRVLVPNHPVFLVPNLIGPEDWEGWVQERGLYFLGEKDERYADLLTTEDPFPFNAGEKRGVLVEAHYGKGRWIYLGLGLWRELPAGVPGSYRLLANLVSLGKDN